MQIDKLIKYAFGLPKNINIYYYYYLFFYYYFILIKCFIVNFFVIIEHIFETFSKPAEKLKTYNFKVQLAIDMPYKSFEHFN